MTNKDRTKEAAGLKARLLAIDPSFEMLLSRKETALALDISEGYMRNMGEKLLPIVWIGGAVKHRLSDVRALIAKGGTGKRTKAGRAGPKAAQEAERAA